MGKKLEGFGGWLLFYVIVLILNIFFLISELSPSWNIQSPQFYDFMIISIDGIMLIFSVDVLWVTLKKRKEAIHLNKLLLWLRFCIPLIFIIYFRHVGINEDKMNDLIGQAFAMFLGASIWSSYWDKSVRVKNTFRH